MAELTSHASQRIRELPPYAFAEVDRRKRELRTRGIEPIDFGVGDPQDPTPSFIREALQRAVDEYAASGYPSYVGSRTFREAAAAWIARRFGVTVDPGTQVASAIGTKEAIFHAPLGFVDPGDPVIVPSPGYPPYSRGTSFAGGTPFFVPLQARNDFLVDLGSIPDDVARRARMLWLNYPNSPTGAVAPRSYLEEAAAWAREHGVILCSDEAYVDIWFTEDAPPTALEAGTDGVLAFYSLSKRSAMTGYRVGFVAGDRELVDVFKKVKTNIDSGTPDFVQEAAVTALGDEDHVREFRAAYRRKRDILADALVEAGLPDCRGDGTFYLWQRLPEGVTSPDFAKELLAPETAVVCTPGRWITQELQDGRNPGDGYVRFALVPPVEEVEEAARRIADALSF